MRASRSLALSLVLALAACDQPPAASSDAGTDAGPRDYRAEPFEPTAATRAYCDAAARGEDDDAIEARITELLSELTVD